MKQHRLREGDITAVDTRTAFTTAGSETAPGPLLVPKGAKFITAVTVAYSANHAVATGATFITRLEGNGLVSGNESFASGASGVPVATGGNSLTPARRLPCNIPVVEGNEIQIAGEMCGTDIGTITGVVGIEFSDKPNAGGAVNKTFTVEGDIASADLRVNLTTQGSVAAPSPVVPSGMKKIDKIIVAAGTEGLADGSQAYFIRIGGNAVRGGEQLLPVSACGRIAVQSGSDAAPQVMAPLIIEDVDIEVVSGDTISISAEGAGTDTGTGHAVVTVLYA